MQPEFLCVAPSARLAALRRLELGGEDEPGRRGVADTLPPDLALPPGLTALSVNAATMPAQLTALTALQDLALLGDMSCVEPEDTRPLARLTRLSLSRYWPQDPSLLHAIAHLRALRVLELRHLRPQDDEDYEVWGDSNRDPVGAEERPLSAAAAAALSCLTALSAVLLDTVPCLHPLPPEASALPLARLCAWQRQSWYPADYDRGGGAALPPGTWQRTLRQVSVDWTLARASRQFLEGAEALERLYVVECAGWSVDMDDVFPPPCWFVASAAGTQADGPNKTPPSAWFWDWAAAHPPLRSLELQAEEESEEGDGDGAEAEAVAVLRRAVRALRTARPGLTARVLKWRWHPKFCTDLPDEPLVGAGCWPGLAVACATAGGDSGDE